MTPAQKITLRLSQVRSRLNEISGLEGDAFTDEIRTEASTLQTEYADLETRHQAAIVGEGDPETRNLDGPDAEMRERVELRSRASLTNFLTAALAGRQVTGRRGRITIGCRCRRRHTFGTVGRADRDPGRCRNGCTRDRGREPRPHPARGVCQ